MAVDLPDYESEKFNRSPLVLVAAQVNYEEVAREIEHRQARNFQGAMGAEWKHLQSAPLIRATMTPQGAVSEPNRQAYRLSTVDDTWSVLINPESVTLESRAYGGWAELRQRFERMVAAVADVFDPATEARLGLRYVNQVRLPDGRTGWDGLLADFLLGLLSDDRFSGCVLASDQRVFIRLDDDTRCLLRHGLLPGEAAAGKSSSYLLDLDVFRENRDYDTGDAMAGIDRLHQRLGQVFRASIKADLYMWLKGDDADVHD